MLGSMYRPFAVCAVATLLVAWCAPNAWAQEPAPPPPAAPTAPAAPAVPTAPAAPEASSEIRSEARGHFEKGLALFDEEAWDAALVEFVRSRTLYPTRAATKDAAFCLRRLHRFDEALDMFEALMAEFPNMPAEDRDIAQREIRSLSALVGRIELTGAEPGATVVIDSRARGAFPLAPVRVSIGTHLVRVLKDGFVPFEANVTVASGQTTPVAVKLAPLMQGGRLKVVEQSGKQVDVLVDSVPIGKTPWEGTLPVGQHSVALVGEGDLGTQPAQAPVRLDEVTALNLALENLDATLRVDPKPIGANVAIDGVIVGRGLWVGRLRSGNHRVEVGAEGFLGATKDIVLGHGAHESLGLELERDPRASLTFKEAEAIRQEWLHRGGSMLTFELRGQGLVIVGGAKPLRNGYFFTGSSPSTGPFKFDDTDVSPGDFSGGGAGGAGIRAAYMYMALPDPSKGSGIWHAFRFGSGADLAFGYWFTSQQSAQSIPPSAVPSANGPPTGTTRVTHYKDGDWRTGWMLNVPITLGYQVAFGTFRGPEWTGAVVGVAWTPSLNVLMPYQFDKATYFVPSGFEASVDIVKGMQSKEKDSYGKVFVYVLPPVKDSFTVISIGGGAVWY
jgi:hypothetical protein